MDLTWIAILASISMGIGAALVFVFAVKKNYFYNVEDAKYHVFWSDLEELVIITLAMAGVLNPILAAGAMLLSSAMVIGNASPEPFPILAVTNRNQTATQLLTPRQTRPVVSVGARQLTEPNQ